MKLNLLRELRRSHRLSNVNCTVVHVATVFLTNRAATPNVDVRAGTALLESVQVLRAVALAGHFSEVVHSLAFMRRVDGVEFHRRHVRVVEVRRWRTGGGARRGLKSEWRDGSIVGEALVLEQILDPMFTWEKMVLLWVPEDWVVTHENGRGFFGKNRSLI